MNELLDDFIPTAIVMLQLHVPHGQLSNKWKGRNIRNEHHKTVNSTDFWTKKQQQNSKAKTPEPRATSSNTLGVPIAGPKPTTNSRWFESNSRNNQTYHYYCFTLSIFMAHTQFFIPHQVQLESQIKRFHINSIARQQSEHHLRKWRHWNCSRRSSEYTKVPRDGSTRPN